MNINTNAVTSTLDNDAGHACTFEVMAHFLANLVILKDEVTVTLAGFSRIREPPRAMILGNAQAIAERIDLLTHL